MTEYTQKIELFVKEYFEQYKKFIVQEIVQQYGKSYQMPEEVGNSWRRTFEYNNEIKDFAILKSKTFLNILPEDKDDLLTCRTFFKLLTRQIADYLSTYAYREKQDANRNEYSAELFRILFTENKHIAAVLFRRKKTKREELKSQKRKQRQQNNKNKPNKQNTISMNINGTIIQLHTPAQRLKILMELNQFTK
ncbi:MAG: hypothetical protein MJ158_00745 [Alphaproteobacteria bacterium]|nr:hypothetical protein [Alphaproteobacteria bacterium]